MGGILVYDMTDAKKDAQKQQQLLVLETLNDLINVSAVNDPDKRAISVAAVVVFSDGSTSSNIAGYLDRAQMTGLLVDLSNQVFFECKHREIQDAAEDALQKVYLASQPAGSKPN